MHCVAVHLLRRGKSAFPRGARERGEGTSSVGRTADLYAPHPSLAERGLLNVSSWLKANANVTDGLDNPSGSDTLSRRVQPPDAENRMSGGVGELRRAIP
jgi:hypothetical protein